jgi:hypothetical protein
VPARAFDSSLIGSRLSARATTIKLKSTCFPAVIPGLFRDPFFLVKKTKSFSPRRLRYTEFTEEKLEESTIFFDLLRGG